MSEKAEFVEVTLKLPKAVVDFIKAIDKPKSLEEHLTKHIVETMQSYVEMLECSPGELIKRFNLGPVFKEYGVFPEHQKEAET